jgi:hypothetical protein
VYFKTKTSSSEMGADKEKKVSKGKYLGSSQETTFKQVLLASMCNKSKDKGKVIDDYALYCPTSTPLTWSSDLYVKELLKVKERLEVVEAKELERDCTIHRIIAENQDLVVLPS